MAEEAAHNCVTRNVTLFPAVYSSTMLYCIGRVKKHEKTFFFKIPPLNDLFLNIFGNQKPKKINGSGVWSGPFF